MEVLRRLEYRSIYADLSESDVARNATDIITELVLDDIVQIRTNVIVTASFNVFVALGIILSIVYDAWKSWRKNGAGREAGARFEFLRSIHPAEVLPLVLSATIMMQGVIFIAVQSLGLKTVESMNCRQIGQIVWPAIWMVSEVLLVFSLEVAYRGLKKDRFAPRGQWNISICWSITAILILLTWIPSKVHHPGPQTHPDKCIASLLWFVAPLWLFGIVFNSIIIFAFFATASLISYQLYKTPKISREERIAASRAVYYLVLGTLLMTFVLPFWVTVPMFSLNKVTPTELATIALNIFGFVNGAAHLILRSNSEKMAIRSSRAAWGRRREWRIFGSADLNLAEHIQRPITISGGDAGDSSRYGGDEKRPLPGLRSPDHQHIPTKETKQPIRAEPSRVKAPPETHSRKMSTYSLFPARDARNRASSFYADDGDDLAPPRPLFARRHKRDSSMMSSATVQIGLRLSHAALAATGLGQRVPTPETSPQERNNKRPGLPDHSSSENSIHLPIQPNIFTPPPAQPSLPNPFDDPSVPVMSRAAVATTNSSQPFSNVQSSGFNTPSEATATRQTTNLQQNPPKRQRSTKDRLFDPLPPIPVSPDTVQPAVTPGPSIPSPSNSPHRAHHRAQIQLSSPRSPPAQGRPSYLPIISPSTATITTATPITSQSQRTPAIPRPVVLQQQKQQQPYTHPSPLRMAPTFPPSSPPPQLPPAPAVTARSPSPELQQENWPLRNSLSLGLGGGPSSSSQKNKTESVATAGTGESSGIILLPSTTYKKPEPFGSSTLASVSKVDKNGNREDGGGKRGSVESEKELVLGLGMERERRDWI